jgi:hypothetical protein
MTIEIQRPELEALIHERMSRANLRVSRMSSCKP